MPALQIHSFDDWIREFQGWQKDIGFDSSLVGDFKFETKFADEDAKVIEFGDYAGDPKWENYNQIPNQQVRDALQHLIVFQGDTEFASVEQQKHLLKTAPTEYDLKSALRIMSEEMRHGWQMCHLLVNFFGNSGKIEAQKQLQRRATENTRLLGAFNQPVRHWLDFFTYTEFVDRDGKYQLTMLSHSAFAPLARSMGPMLKEESFHLGTGHTGLKRILQAGKVPTPILQKWFNKWVPTAFDLFGTDSSGSANWAYVWGLKCRYNEFDNPGPLDKEHLNEASRELYRKECLGLVENLNAVRRKDQPALVLPDLKFNRAIGNHKGEHWTIDGSRRLSDREWADYEAQHLPTPEDEARVQEIFKEKNWIAPRGG